MEYYIFTTKNCNLDCVYCTIKRHGHSGIRPQYKMSNLVDFIRSIESNEKKRENRSYDHPVVVFYGGEPLLNQEFMKEFIKLDKGNGTEYILHTNGILLDTIDYHLLNSLSKIFVSVDGEREINDRCRGTRSFEKAVKNVQKVRKIFPGEILARMTLAISRDGSLCRNVLNISNLFDSVFWQIENSPESKDAVALNRFKKRYDFELKHLIRCWVNHLKNGVFKDIVPLRAIASSLLSGKQHRFLRCGCGTELVVVDTDGICYMCDELMERKEFQIGHIHNSISFENTLACEELSSHCSVCDITHICAGRCLHSLLYFPKEMFDFYCDCTRILVRRVKNVILQIEKLLQNGTIRIQDLEKTCYNEEIP